MTGPRNKETPAERLHWLALQPRISNTDARRINDATDELVAARVAAEEALRLLEEAARELYDDFASINPPELLPLPIQKIGAALAAVPEENKEAKNG